MNVMVGVWFAITAIIPKWHIPIVHSYTADKLYELLPYYGHTEDLCL